MLEDEVLQITQNVWRCMLEMEVHVSSVSSKEMMEQLHSSGVVHISGAWNGSVSLVCPNTLVEKAGVIILGDAAAELGKSAIVEVLGELVNILGGNIKAILPAPSYLSQPMVVDGESYEMNLLGVECVTHLMMECESTPFQLNIYQHQ
ncbi:MAG: chemotaxis protein CheX [Mariprofundus sp.]|nr:chemotaxis protein CheX [Mariprofundus sp.]